MEKLDEFFFFFLSGYSLAALSALVLRRVFVSHREFLNDVINYIGIILLIGEAICLLSLITEVFYFFYSGVEYEQYAFSSGSYSFYIKLWLLYVIISPLLLIWLNLIKNNRQKNSVLIICSVILMAPTILERLVIIITSLHRDYLPSSLSSLDLPGYLLKLVLTGAIYLSAAVITALISRKIKSKGVRYLQH